MADELKRGADGKLDESNIEQYLKQLEQEVATTSVRHSKIDKYKDEVILLAKHGATLRMIAAHLKKKKVDVRTTTIRRWLEKQASLDNELARAKALVEKHGKGRPGAKLNGE
jgi:transposase-like protein